MCAIQSRLLPKYAIPLLAVATICLVTWIPGEEPHSRGASSVLIGELANDNPEPRIVSTATKDVPVFDRKYDWKRQDGVLEAVRKLSKLASAAIWEQLVAHESDSHYFITCSDDAENGFAVNWTVGDFCSTVAYSQLTFPVVRHLDLLPKLPINEAKEGSGKPPQLPKPFIRDLRAWRRSQPGKTFRDLQIDVCKRAMDDLSQLDVDEHSKKAFREAVGREIVNIAKSKDGIIEGFGDFIFPGDRYGLFNAKSARRIRNEIEAAAR